MSTYLTQYQSANLGDEQIIENFVVRQKEFAKVMSDIRTTDKKSSFQHYIFVGRRGSGKSTLLRRIQAEVNTDKKLQKRFFVANLSEEQAGIYKLHDLWDYVTRELTAQGIEVQEVDWQAYEDDLKSYSKALYQAILQSLKKEKKQLIVCIDNIDRILRNIGDEANLFREQLMNSNAVRIIGGSTIMAEDFWRYDLPFYQFFTIKRLEPLSIDEVKTLLKHWASMREMPGIEKLVLQHPGKLQAIRILTDGTPRTMLLFVDMLIANPGSESFEYLQRIVDHATPIYQERLAQLSPQQQKIAVELAFFLEAASIEQLVPVCKMSSRTISSQMNQLSKAKIVEKIKGEGRILHYRLEERFFNLWLLMTQGGPKEKREAKYLTAFLESWYDKDEILGFFDDLVWKIENEESNEKLDGVLVKVLSQSKHLRISERDELLEIARLNYGRFNYWRESWPESFKDIFEEAQKLFMSGCPKEALQKIAGIEQEDYLKYLLLASFSETINRDEYLVKAKELLAKEGEPVDDDERALHAMLAYLSGDIDSGDEILKESNPADEMLDGLEMIKAEAYFGKEDYENAEVLYLSLLKKGALIAANDLGRLYEVKGELSKAEKYYEIGLSAGFIPAASNLIRIYYLQNRKKDQALLLRENSGLKLATNPIIILTSALLSLWVGEMDEFQTQVDKIWVELEHQSNEILEYLIIELLVHKQYSYLEGKFSSKSSKSNVKSLFRPISYALEKLMNMEEKLSGSVPPEFEEVVEAVVKSVLTRRKVYYPDSA